MNRAAKVFVERLMSTASVVVRDVTINGFLASPVLPRRLRGLVFSLLGMDVRGSSISSNCHMGGLRIKIGRDTHINRECFIDNSAYVSIGSRCNIGSRTMIITGAHDVATDVRRAGPAYARAVQIGDGTWVGANVTILPGVSIGSGCVIGAGAVVTKDCESNSVYFGVPARRGRSLN